MTVTIVLLTIRINEDHVNSFALNKSVCMLSDGDFSLMNIYETVKFCFAFFQKCEALIRDFVL